MDHGKWPELLLHKHIDNRDIFGIIDNLNRNCDEDKNNKECNTLTVPAMSNPEANKSITLNAIYTPSRVEATEMIKVFSTISIHM